jgi:hypothetical protein
VRHELKRVAAIADPSGPPKVIDRDRIDSGLGEALGELFVEVMQAADIRDAVQPDGFSAQSEYAANLLPSAAVRVISLGRRRLH